MTKVARRESFFQDLFDFRRDFHELFNQLTTGWPSSTEPTARLLTQVPPVEAWVVGKPSGTICGWLCLARLRGSPCARR